MVRARARLSTAGVVILDFRSIGEIGAAPCLDGAVPDAFDCMQTSVPTCVSTHVQTWVVKQVRSVSHRLAMMQRTMPRQL